jgi:uncharacterized protein YcfL
VKKLLMAFLFTILFVCYQGKENTVRKDALNASVNEDKVAVNGITANTITDDAMTVKRLSTVMNDDSKIQNDLVYYNYDSGIQLSSNSRLQISQLDLNLEDETAIIYAINLKKDEVIKLCDYIPNQDISFSPPSDGVYIIIAAISNGEIIDITSEAISEVIVESNSNENLNGFVLLN